MAWCEVVDVETKKFAEDDQPRKLPCRPTRLTNGAGGQTRPEYAYPSTCIISSVSPEKCFCIACRASASFSGDDELCYGHVLPTAAIAIPSHPSGHPPLAFA